MSAAGGISCGSRNALFMRVSRWPKISGSDFEISGSDFKIGGSDFKIGGSDFKIGGLLF